MGQNAPIDLVHTQKFYSNYSRLKTASLAMPGKREKSILISYYGIVQYNCF